MGQSLFVRGCRDEGFNPPEAVTRLLGGPSLPSTLTARAVAMAFPGQRPGDAGDGWVVYFDVTEMQQSINYRLLTQGWVYPTFHSKQH